MKKISLLLTIALMIVMTGCGSQKPVDLDGNLLSYDLGEGTLTDSSGRKVPYEIQGVLGIPEGKNCPIVVLIHGAHPIEKASESRYDKGFNYLAQALSEQGNLVISMNVAMNYSFEDGEPNGNERMKQILSQQLELLKSAIDGDQSIFDYNLSGIGDFSRMILMGHSRGGLDVLECAENLPERMKTVGIVSVAPSEYKVLETDLPDVPVGIIIPQLDGDVISLDGSDIYEYFVEDTQYTKTAELIYLKNANHGHFNTQLTQPDLNSTEDDLAKLMSAEQQQRFLTAYLIDFVKSVTDKGESVFAAAPELESHAYGCDVLLRVLNGAKDTLWSAQDGETLTCEGTATVERQIASYLPDQNTVLLFRLPGGASLNQYALSRIVWSEAGASVTVPLCKAQAEYRFLDIDMTIDSTDSSNVGGQSMTLTLFDANGNKEEYVVDRSAAALLWQEGELVEQIGWDGQLEQEYSTYTPLVTLRIDLSKLRTVDSGQLTSVKMVWNDESGGSAMLRSVSGVI